MVGHFEISLSLLTLSKTEGIGGNSGHAEIYFGPSIQFSAFGQLETATQRLDPIVFYLQ